MRVWDAIGSSGVSIAYRRTTPRERIAAPAARGASADGGEQDSVQTSSEAKTKARFYHDSEVLAR